jgi:hypothetical protein
MAKPLELPDGVLTVCEGEDTPALLITTRERGHELRPTYNRSTSTTTTTSPMPILCQSCGQFQMPTSAPVRLADLGGCRRVTMWSASSAGVLLAPKQRMRKFTPVPA